MADNPPPQNTPGVDATTMLTGYEYVVVGSGAGGGPLAARLARAGRKVLLLEAGDDQGANINQQVPAFHARSSEDELMRWNYFVRHYADEARAQKDSKVTWETPGGNFHVGPGAPAGSKLKGILYPRAGTLGGCSAHHALITLYPHESDWDYIASLTGDASWAAKNMRKYYERLESCEYVPQNTPGHGFTGWLGTNRADVKLALGDIKVLSILKGAASAMTDSVIEGWEELTGILLRDLNSSNPRRDSTEAIYQLPLSMRGGKRSGVRDFVVATANGKNEDGSKKYPLDIRTGCLATQILFDRDQKPPKAVGVEFLDGKSLYRADSRSRTSGAGTKGRVMVSREVIVSAGAFNTPQLLKLSGLGPKDELDKFQINLVAELPRVGQNLQDRYEVGMVSKLEDDFQVVAKCTFGKPGDPCLEEFHQGRGPYLSNGLTVGIVKKSSVAERDPDLFVFGGPAYFKGYFPGYSERTVADKEHFTWAVLKAHTRNRNGTVKLKSADPLDTPQIDFNYFDTGTTEGHADELDLAAIVEGVRLARRIMDDLPSVAGDVKEEVPGRGVASTEQIKDSIKNEAFGHHASCTCPMGPDGDPKAVLDSRFRVRGVKNLRVVDASVFPRIPGIFLILPIFMISEKAADIILEDV